MKRILHIAHRLPYPPNKGDKIRTYNFLKFLAKRHELHLATLIDDPADLLVVPELENQVNGLVYERIDQPGRSIYSLREIFRRRSITVCHFYSRRLQDKIDDVIETTEFDAVLCSSSPMAEYLFRSRHRKGRLLDIPKTMDLIDVDSFKWRQYADRSSGPKAWVYRHEARALADYEAALYDYFQNILLVSEREKEYFPIHDQHNKLHAVSNGVDLDYFSNSSAPTANSTHSSLVFTGMMDYWPNIEGMRWFVAKVFPKIRKDVPECRLTIVGGRPTREVLGWGEDDNIQVTGFVDDVRGYIASADLCIAPLRIARGIQNKVLEAMSMRKPVVATPYALEGIDVDSGEHVIAAATVDEFATAVTCVLHDHRMARTLGENARTRVEQQYSWDACIRPLEDLLLSTAVESGGPVAA